MTGTIKGSVANSNPTAGACAPVTDANGTNSYDAICAHSGSCQCLSVTRLALTGGFGKGTANLAVTVDESSAVLTGPAEDACGPAFGVFTFSIPAKGKIAGRTQTLSVMGAVCGNAGTTTVATLGGFSIEGSTANPKTSGSGTFIGSVSKSGSLLITVSGSIANP